MYRLLTFLSFYLLTLPAAAQEELSSCVESRDINRIVSEYKLLAPTAAVVTARRAMGNADVLRADLCKRNEKFIYVITALKNDGRVLEVFVSPESGKVVNMQ